MDKPTDALVRNIAEILSEKGWTLCVAESVTVGHLQSAIGRIPGASDFFAGGITAYSLNQKVRHLGVDPEIAAKCNCVSDEVARQMATGVGRLFTADIAIATTGYAEPYPEQGVEHPFAFFAIASQGTAAIAERIGGPPFDAWLSPTDRRQAAQEYFTEIALRALSKELQDK